MNFTSQLNAISESLKEKDTSPALIEGMLKRLSEAHEAELGKLMTQSHQHEKKAADRLDEVSALHGQLSSAKMDKGIEAIWRSCDGERLLELAYRQNPKAATVALNSFVGGYRIATELRDRLLSEARELPAASATA